MKFLVMFAQIVRVHSKSDFKLCREIKIFPEGKKQQHCNIKNITEKSLYGDLSLKCLHINFKILSYLLYLHIFYILSRDLNV